MTEECAGWRLLQLNSFRTWPELTGVSCRFVFSCEISFLLFVRFLWLLFISFLKGLDFRFKGSQGIQGKLIRNNKGWGESLGRQKRIFDDALRYTVEIPTNNYAAGVSDAVKQMEAKGYKFSKIKNTWSSPDYKGINAVVEGPGKRTWWGGQKAGGRFELQFHTPESFATKQGEMHKIYEQLRSVNGPKKGTAAYEKLIEKSRELSAAIPKPTGVDEIASKVVNLPQSKIGALMEATRMKGITLAAKDAALIASKGWTGAGFGAATRQIGRNLAAGASKLGSLAGKAAVPLAVAMAGHSVAMSAKDIAQFQDDANKGTYNGKARRDAIFGVTTDLVLGKGGTVALGESISKGLTTCKETGAVNCVRNGAKSLFRGAANLAQSAGQATKKCFGDVRQCGKNIGNGAKSLAIKAGSAVRGYGEWVQGRIQKRADRKALCSTNPTECARVKASEKANRDKARAAGKQERKENFQKAVQKVTKQDKRFVYGGAARGAARGGSR